MLFARTFFHLQDDLRQEEEEREVDEVEMLLGAYSMMLDSTWNKLTDVYEFVEDAEVSEGLPRTRVSNIASFQCVYLGIAF